MYFHLKLSVQNAKRFRLVSIDSTKPEESNWEDIVPEHEKVNWRQV